MINYQPLYTFTETAEVMKLSQKELRSLIMEGQLGYVLVAERPLVRGIDLEEYICNLTKL